MDLTALRVRDARQVISGVEAADITNPDLPHPTAVLLITRATETLRTTADHAERQQTTVDQQQATIDRLRDDVRRLESKVRELKAKRAAA
ncbi:PspA/IM30 family protein [Streptomyces sp. NPDC052043]|uniref:PspA/IM30 family protein n=1 Tax=Streptomyces sp. NPDC052043 TaxID=3365684 RepID=UPI0037CEC0BF